MKPTSSRLLQLFSTRPLELLNPKPGTLNPVERPMTHGAVCIVLGAPTLGVLLGTSLPSNTVWGTVLPSILMMACAPLWDCESALAPIPFADAASVITTTARMESAYFMINLFCLNGGC